MGVAERKARGKEVLRQSILNAAVELIVEHGFENLSIRKIAEKIEYAPSTIYLYFRDKYEIVATICEDMFDRLHAELVLITAQYPDPLQGLRQGLRCYIDFGLTHRSHYLVTFCTPVPELPENHPTKKIEAGMRCFDVLRDTVRQSIGTGRIRPLNVDLLSQSIWTSIHGVTALLITCGHDPHFPWVAPEALIEHTLDVVLRGILVNPEEISLDGFARTNP
jgi:AcrR family transcriptional regulator